MYFRTMMTVPFAVFLDRFQTKLSQVFHTRADIDKVSVQRGLPPFVMREIMSCSPLSTCIPAEYGGRGGHIHESLSILSASAYESLALGLTFGINWALFLQPVAKYARVAAATRYVGGGVAVALPPLKHGPGAQSTVEVCF